jgi:hypothetical protein
LYFFRTESQVVESESGSEKESGGLYCSIQRQKEGGREEKHKQQGTKKGG